MLLVSQFSTQIRLNELGNCNMEVQLKQKRCLVMCEHFSNLVFDLIVHLRTLPYFNQTQGCDDLEFKCLIVDLANFQLREEQLSVN